MCDYSSVLQGYIIITAHAPIKRVQKSTLENIIPYFSLQQLAFLINYILSIIFCLHILLINDKQRVLKQVLHEVFKGVLTLLFSLYLMRIFFFMYLLETNLLLLHTLHMTAGCEYWSLTSCRWEEVMCI